MAKMRSYIRGKRKNKGIYMASFFDLCFVRQVVNIQCLGLPLVALLTKLS